MGEQYRQDKVLISFFLSRQIKAVNSFIMKQENNKESGELIRLRKRLTTRFNKACQEYSLIVDNDKILIGLSGGKDSLALVELLGKRQRIYKPKFSVVAAHIIVEDIGYQSDATYLEAFCKEHGVEFHLINTHISDSDTIEQDSKPYSREKNMCFLCSWYRRKALFDAARDLGCNKIALGHHKDDIVETLLMNLIFQGAFATMPPTLKMDKFDMTIIRPLCLLKEDEVQEYAILREYRKVPKLCPFEKESSRAKIKQLVKEIETLNPKAKDSIWSAMENIKIGYLPQKV